MIFLGGYHNINVYANDIPVIMHHTNNKSMPCGINIGVMHYTVVKIDACPTVRWIYTIKK